MTIEQIRNQLSKLLDMSEDQLKKFDEASNHPYKCRCEICLEYWKLVGPDDDD